MSLNPTDFGYLWPPTHQFVDANGIPLSGGWIELYQSGTTLPAVSYLDWDGTVNAMPIRLDTLGRATALVPLSTEVDLYVYTASRSLVYSALHLGGKAEPDPVELTGLVRSLVPLSDNVRFQTVDTLPDGTEILGLEVAEPDIPATSGMKQGLLVVNLSSSVVDNAFGQIVSESPTSISTRYLFEPNDTSLRPQCYIETNRIMLYPSAVCPALAVHTQIHLKSWSGFEPTDVARWGYDESSKQLAGALSRTFDAYRDTHLLSNGVYVPSASTVSCESEIRLTIPFLYPG